MSERHQLDARGLLCPMPVIRLQNFIQDLPTGSEVELLATDPGVNYDVPAWCRVHGHEVLRRWRNGETFHLLIRIGSK